MGKVVGIEQSRISQMEKESIININITLLPDLRYKISKENEKEVGKTFVENGKISEIHNGMKGEGVSYRQEGSIRNREKQAQSSLSLESYGITFNESMRAKALYDYPEQVNEAIDEAIEMGEEIKLKAERRAGGLLEKEVRERWETDKYSIYKANISKLKLSERKVDLKKPRKLRGLLIWIDEELLIELGLKLSNLVVGTLN